MITMLIAAIVMQVQVPARDADPPREQDVPSIIDAALDFVLPADTKIGVQLRVGNRPIFLDVSETTRAFQQELIPEMSPSAVRGVRRARLAPSKASVMTCFSDTGLPNCRVTENGFYAAVSEARRTKVPGEYLVKFVVLWGKLPIGFNQELFFRRVNGEWRVVREGLRKEY